MYPLWLIKTQVLPLTNARIDNFVHDQWANGDPATPPPPASRKGIRNQGWKHMHLDDVISMPDSWEYPFFAAWVRKLKLLQYGAFRARIARLY